MSEYETSANRPEIEDIGERLIPDIPGVSNPVETSEEWGTLHEELDEESDEDVLEEVNVELRETLKTFGVEGIQNATRQDIIQLWHRMEMSNFLIADLALYTTRDIQSKSLNPLAQPHFNDLRQQSEVMESAYDIRRKLIEQVAPNLMKLGYGRLDAYRLPRSQKENLALAFRTEGWLLDLYFMSELPQQVRAAVRASPNQSITKNKLFQLTKDEIVRQARIIDSEETREKYDPRLSSHASAYKELRKSVKNAYQIADRAFAKYI